MIVLLRDGPRQTKCLGLRRDRHHRYRRQNLGRSRSCPEPSGGRRLRIRCQLRTPVKLHERDLGAYMEGEPEPEPLVERVSG